MLSALFDKNTRGVGIPPMKACLLQSPARIETNPLVFADVPAPQPATGEVLVRVSYCGVCRTDLHVIEGELLPQKSPVIPGHQVVGTIEKLGPNANTGSASALRSALPGCIIRTGRAEFCRSGTRESLRPPHLHRLFRGRRLRGLHLVAPEDFTYAIPKEFPDEQAAPLLCAGVIGFSLSASFRDQARRQARLLWIWRSGAYCPFRFRDTGISRCRRHTRDARHQKLALELGAKWAGGTVAEPPAKLDAAIVFAPTGEIIPAALKALWKGGSLVLGGIHMSPIPSFDYDLLYQERVIRSVANNTRQDGEDFLRVAAEIPIHTHTQLFPLREANRALNALKNDAIEGAAVLKVEA